MRNTLLAALVIVALLIQTIVILYVPRVDGARAPKEPTSVTSVPQVVMQATPIPTATLTPTIPPPVTAPPDQCVEFRAGISQKYTDPVPQGWVELRWNEQLGEMACYYWHAVPQEYDLPLSAAGCGRCHEEFRME